MKLKTYNTRLTKQEQKALLKKTAIKMEDIDLRLKQKQTQKKLKKKRVKPRSRLGGGGMGVSAQGGVNNFLGMLRR